MQRFASSRSLRFFLASFAVLLLLTRASASFADQEKSEDARVYVILWFDTEDYLLPADDDATLRISEFLTSEGIRCTHKLVGEKARVLEKRGRNDVIEAIKKHEVGYHSDFHSVQPSPALFLSRQGWDDGVAEFDRRQRQGMLDVERITGQKPSCYGQPGSSWGPQQFGAMRKWDMPVYLDAGSHVTLDGDPFWYCGILNLYGLRYTLRTKLGGSMDLEEAKTPFEKAYDALLAKGGGMVSIYYHPCEFVHKQFWDGVNFMKGANPPRSEWKVPPQKSAEESRVAYETFEGYIRFIKSHPKVQFVTAREALKLYSDQAQGHEVSTAEVKMIAAGVHGDINFQVLEKMTLAPSEQFDILNQFVLLRSGGENALRLKFNETLLGPTQSPPEHTETRTTRSQFERTVADVAEYTSRHGRIPNAVWLGSSPISPESYLRTLAEAAATLADNKPLPETIVFRATQLLSASHVSDDNPKLWGWVIFPPDFHAPEMMQLAKRQAWTLKPAVLRR